MRMLGHALPFWDWAPVVLLYYSDPIEGIGRQAVRRAVVTCGYEV